MLKKILSILFCIILAISSCFVIAVPANAANSSLDASKLTDYALTYWQNYNDAYSNYNSVGGDCANFVSQCLHAAGMPMDSSWYWYSYSNCSKSWIGCVSLKSYLLNNYGCTVIASPSASQIAIGDVLYYDNGQHVGICSEIINGHPWVCAHNNNRHTSNWTLGYSTYAVIKTSSLFGSSSGLGTVSITSPSNLQYLNPMNPGNVSWNAYSGAKSYSYTVREVTYNNSTGKYDDTNTYLCQRVNTTAKSFSLNKDDNDDLNEYVKNWGAYKIWVGAFSDTSCNTLIAENIIYVCMNHIAKTPDLKTPFASSKTQIKSNLYTDTFFGTVSPEQDLIISWTNTAQTYDYSVKALGGNPDPNNNESGNTLKSGNKQSITAITVSASLLKKYAGKYVKVYLKAYDTTCDDESCSAYYYFMLGTVQPDEPDFTLTYNANGGNDAPATQRGAATYAISDGVPKREGFIFLGWSESNTATTASYVVGSTITLTKDTTLYAVWKENPPDEDYGVFLSVHDITVGVDKSGGAFSVTTIPSGQSVDFSLSNPQIALYSVQTDWDGAFSGDFYGLKAGTAILTATMQYGGKTYTDTCMVRVLSAQPSFFILRYDLNGGTATPPPPAETNDTSYTISSIVPTRSGFTFLGWSESSTATTASYVVGSTITLMKDTTLYAVWQKEPPITLIAISVQSLPVKTNYTVNEVFDPSGLTLTVTYSDGSTQTVTNGFICSGFDSTSGGTKMITVSYEDKATTFFVTIVPLTVYTLTYDANGGNGSPVSQTGCGSLLISTIQPEREGYVFLGWATSSTAILAQFASGAAFNLTTNTTLYAVWQKVENPDDPTVNPTITIRNYVASKTVDYRTTITFSADPVQNPVAGAKVHWFIDGQDQGTGNSFTVNEAKESFTVQAKYVKDGNTLAESFTEKVNVRTGFFAKLKALFRALFRTLPKQVQKTYDIEFYLKFLP